MLLLNRAKILEMLSKDTTRQACLEPLKLRVFLCRNGQLPGAEIGTVCFFWLISSGGFRIA